jgi:hypothetical protein
LDAAARLVVKSRGHALMSDALPDHVDPEELHMYLALALERHGISKAADDLVVKEITSASGRTVYVIIAFGGSQAIPLAFWASPYRGRSRHVGSAAG